MAKWKLQTEIDKAVEALMVVIVKGDADLEAKMAGLGTRVGAKPDWASRPTVDGIGKPLSVNDTFRLEATDGTHPAGMYARKADNSEWEDTPFLNFDNLGIAKIIEDAKAGLTDIAIDPITGAVTATVDKKFTTPLQIKDALTKVAEANKELYHPKGGNANLKILAKQADENTEEVIVASQANIVYTVAEIQAKYDAL